MIDWTQVRRVLVVRLRSIGDTVLATPSLIALKRFLPAAEIDVLLEDWVAPLLADFDAADNVLPVGAGKRSRLRMARRLRRRRYDVVFNLHGGTTSTIFTAASGARHRVGFRHYRYNFLYNHLLSASADFWKREHTHSAEQQLALLGFVGVPVKDKPKSRLPVTARAAASIDKKLAAAEISALKGRIALIHPAAATATKQWAPENFARVAEHLSAVGFQAVAVATRKERAVLEKLCAAASVPVRTFDDLTLPEITALAAQAAVFIGNDSGVAHVAAAAGTPAVVIFGSSNVHHWQPWTDAPHRIVREELACQPCAGFVCREFGEPECIKRVKVERVIRAVEEVTKKDHAVRSTT